MVDAGQAGDVADQLVQQGRLDQVGLLGDERLLRQNNFLSSGRVRGEQTPVNEASVAEIWILAVLRGERQDLLDQLLGVRGSLEEQLDDAGEQLELDLAVLVVEVVEEGLEQLVCVVDPLRTPR